MSQATWAMAMPALPSTAMRPMELTQQQRLRPVPSSAEQSAAADRYLAERVATASPAELIGMLFDAAVSSLNKALALQQAGSFADASPLLLKAQDIVMELRCSLNADAGALAASLDSIYVYAHERLVHANMRRDPSAIVETIAVIDPLRQAWRESCLRKAPTG